MTLNAGPSSGKGLLSQISFALPLVVIFLVVQLEMLRSRDIKAEPTELSQIGRLRKPTHLDYMMAEGLLKETNRVRSANGLAPVIASDSLSDIARTHSRNMCLAGELKHESDKYPHGWQTFGERMKRAGCSAGAENLAYRTYAGNPMDWARNVITGWLNSPQHRTNLLQPTYRYVGIGVFMCRNGVAFATQVFSP